jgi:hypothetical protein
VTVQRPFLEMCDDVEALVGEFHSARDAWAETEDGARRRRLQTGNQATVWASDTGPFRTGNTCNAGTYGANGYTCGSCNRDCECVASDASRARGPTPRGAGTTPSPAPRPATASWAGAAATRPASRRPSTSPAATPSAGRARAAPSATRARTSPTRARRRATRARRAPTARPSA